MLNYFGQENGKDGEDERAKNGEDERAKRSKCWTAHSWVERIILINITLV